MCDDEKLRALLGILQYSVNGDIVEIGSWWGKSAFVLAWLARCFDIGKLLCVDPWTNDHLIQNEEKVDSGSMQVSAEEALGVFQIGLLPFNSNHINYLRMTSVDGAAYFNDCQVVDTAVFGKTEYRGQISVLHIDGNHSYHSVSADVDSWTKFITVGGWIIFDDYIWPYGNGPQRVGDEFFKSWNRFCHGKRIVCSIGLGSIGCCHIGLTYEFMMYFFNPLKMQSATIQFRVAVPAN